MTGRIGRQTAVRMAVNASFDGLNVAAGTASDLAGQRHSLMWCAGVGDPRNLVAEPQEDVICGLSAYISRQLEGRAR